MEITTKMHFFSIMGVGRNWHKITYYCGVSSLKISEFVNTVLVAQYVCIRIERYILTSFFIWKMENPSYYFTVRSKLRYLWVLLTKSAFILVETKEQAFRYET